MENKDIKNVFEEQQAFFKLNSTKNISFRKENLKKIRQILIDNEKDLYAAIDLDFGKSEFETFATEVGLIHKEINHFISKLDQWSRKKHIGTNLANFPAKSYIIPEPLGTVLVIGAWNYPFQLSLIPMISAMAAGNTVILKPSEISNNTSAVMAKIINSNFDSKFIHVIEGGVAQTTTLINLPFDKIFFTGSTKVGKIVYEAAAKNLTPVTLELGGKSPAIILPDANIKKTVQRLVWAKFLNAGQTCTAPDYVFVHQSIKEEFLEEIKREIQLRYTDLESDNYVRIINDNNFNRLDNLFDKNDVYFGGEMYPDKRIIAPTILSDIPLEHKVMQEEIFGPILPVFAYSDIMEAVDYVKSKDKPLALYAYTKSRKASNKILNEISFGGGCVNDSIMHQTNPDLPFGGVGKSGMGSYHGKVGFDAFTHYKSILHKPFWLELPIKYAPYSNFKMKLIKLLMR